jgi:hypothetical protein
MKLLTLQPMLKSAWRLLKRKFAAKRKIPSEFMIHGLKKRTSGKMKNANMSGEFTWRKAGSK